MNIGKIIVIGSINMDIVARMESLPSPGETVFGSELHYIPGGKGSNQAVSASRLSEHTYLVGKLGNDEFGRSLTDFLGNENLNLGYLSYSDLHPSGVALISVDNQSENSIVVVSGSNQEVTESDVSSVEIRENDVVVSVFEIPQETIKYSFMRAQKANARTILNPAPAMKFCDGLLETVDYLVVNETELAFFLKQKQISKDLDTLVRYAKQFRHHDNQVIIITLGSKGVVCVSREGVIRLDGMNVKAVDTTGAGDCFTGAFAVAISENMPLEDALLFANTAASLSVQQIGASTSMPYREEVEEALQQISY